MPAALWRKHHLGELDAQDAGLMAAEFEADYFGNATQDARFVVIGLPAPTLDLAARLVAVHGVPAHDGVQLASAVAARLADPGCTGFACFDQPLRRAAAAEAFDLVP